MRFQRTFVFCLLVFLSAFPFSRANAKTNLLFILDSSGSMRATVDGAPKIVSAKRVLNETLLQLPLETRVGFMS